MKLGDFVALLGLLPGVVAEASYGNIDIIVWVR